MGQKPSFRDTFVALFGFLAPHSPFVPPARKIEQPQAVPPVHFQLSFYQALEGVGVVIKQESAKAQQHYRD